MVCINAQTSKKSIELQMTNGLILGVVVAKMLATIPKVGFAFTTDKEYQASINKFYFLECCAGLKRQNKNDKENILGCVLKHRHLINT